MLFSSASGVGPQSKSTLGRDQYFSACQTFCQLKPHANANALGVTGIFTAVGNPSAESWNSNAGLGTARPFGRVAKFDVDALRGETEKIENHVKSRCR